MDLLFRSFEAKEEFLRQVDELRKNDPKRPIAFALLNAGIIEFLALRLFLLQRFGANYELRYATRLPFFMIEPFSYVWRRVLGFLYSPLRPPPRIKLISDEIQAQRPIIINIDGADRRRAFETPVSEVELAYLSAKHPELLLVPVAFVWRRTRPLESSPNPDISEKAWKALWQLLLWPWYLLLGDPYRPKGLRKLAIMLRGYAKSTVRIAESFRVSDMDARALRRKVLQSINVERKTIIGPSFKSTRSIRESLLRDPGFRDFIRHQSAETGRKERALFRQADRYFQEISAQYSYFMVETGGWILNRVFNTIFDGVVTRDEDFKKLRDAAKEGTLIYVPCHKSYVDFLLLSYVLFQKAFVPPHIAAGLNLNFWPVGTFFKRCGAFFIRRSFRGNDIYAEVFRRYVNALVSAGVSIEFFMEGTRSRNGKLAPPKFGLLKMLVEGSISGEAKKKMRIVPVSIAYEQVTEGRAHRRELEGGQKSKENIINVMKSTKVLLKSYGKVHIRIAEPIALEKYIENELSTKPSDENARKLCVQKLAFEISHRINRETPVTGVGLVCGTLLARQGCALMKAELEIWLQRVRSDLLQTAAQLSPDLIDNFEATCKSSVQRLIDEGVIENYSGPSGQIGYRIPRGQRVSALYYKNSAIHSVVLMAIHGLSRGNAQVAIELRTWLQFEFFFEDKESFITSFSKIPKESMTTFYALWLEDTLENIAVGLETLKAHSEDPCDEREWRSRCMRYGKIAILESTVGRIESVNTQSFSAFVSLALNRGWLLVASTDPSKKEHVAAPAPVLDKALTRLSGLRHKQSNWEGLRQAYGVQGAPSHNLE